jgi:hypothetical protein
MSSFLYLQEEPAKHVQKYLLLEMAFQMCILVEIFATTAVPSQQKYKITVL